MKVNYEIAVLSLLTLSLYNSALSEPVINILINVIKKFICEGMFIDVSDGLAPHPGLLSTLRLQLPGRWIDGWIYRYFYFFNSLF